MDKSFNYSVHLSDCAAAHVSCMAMSLTGLVGPSDVLHVAGSAILVMGSPDFSSVNDKFIDQKSTRRVSV